jgi:hypothetical protein
MDRNGKKAKAVRSDANLNAERSDSKASARDTLGQTGANSGRQGGKETGNAPGAPASPGRKGHRG